MVRSIILLIFFWLFLLFSLLMFIPYLLFWIIPVKPIREAWVHWATTLWAWANIKVAGAKITVKGRENLPPRRSGNICYISNHQGYADIGVILAYAPTTVGFVAKKELLPVPILSWWMLAMHCLFIDRKNVRRAIKTIDRGVKNIRKGYPMLIFPEGTRSRSDRMGPFKAGSLKLAVRSRADIYPLTIQGSYRIWEEHKRVVPSAITLTVHPPVKAEEYLQWNKKELAGRLEKIVGQPLEEKLQEREDYD